jgi:cytochrome b561
MLDQPDSFGWISILVHWLTTVLVITLWFIGRSIAEQGSFEAIDARRNLHVTIALSSWLLLLFRIVWRLRMHHPRASGQSLFIHRIARTVHYIMLVVLSLMMISGPVMAWAENKNITDVAYIVHSYSANVLLGLVLLHIGGTLKHIIFHEDDTIVRMLWPKKR